MLDNLRKALNDRKMPIKHFAEFLDLSEGTIQNKLKGETEFTWSEVMKIHKFLFPQYDVYYLFATQDQQSA